MGQSDKEEMGFKKNQIEFLEMKTAVTNCHTEGFWRKSLPSDVLVEYTRVL